MIDLALLRVLKYHEQLEKVRSFIPMSAIDKRTKAIVLDIGKYFALHPQEDVIDFPTFRSLFFTTWHKNLKKDDVDYYNTLITKMEDDVPEHIQRNLINQLIVLEFATLVANDLEKYNDDGEIDILAVVEKRLEKAQATRQRVAEFEYTAFEEDVVEELIEQKGYKWPLAIMNEHYRNILAGDMYVVGARPGKGKTTFLCQLNASMAQDMAQNKVIVWFNNESRRQRIMSRQIQSALRKTNVELADMQKSGTLTQAYVDAMGHKERVRVYDIHGKNHVYIMDVLESIGIDNVGAIIFDMLDNVKFHMPDGMREDQRLEQMYQWARELGVLYDCPVFPTSQVSNEGAGLMFPSENMLKDSKTGKQGACDGILMIGSSDDPLRAAYRGISFPKEKHKREGKEHLREEIVFDSDRGVYVG